MNKKKVMALLLSATMAFSAMPVGVFAEEVSQESAVEDDGELMQEGESEEPEDAIDLGVTGASNGADQLADGLDDLDSGMIEDDGVIVDQETADSALLLNEVAAPRIEAVTPTEVEIAKGQQVTMKIKTVSTNDFAVTYTWTDGDNVLGQGETLTVTADESTTYRCLATFTDRKNSSYQLTHGVDFDVKIPTSSIPSINVEITSSLGEDRPALVGQPITYTANVDQVVSSDKQLKYTYRWSDELGRKFEETTSASTSTWTFTPEKGFDGNGELTCAVTVTDSDGKVIYKGYEEDTMSQVIYASASSIDQAAELYDVSYMDNELAASVNVQGEKEVYFHFTAKEDGNYVISTDDNVSLLPLNQNRETVSYTNYKYNKNAKDNSAIYLHLTAGQSYYLKADISDLKGTEGKQTSVSVSVGKIELAMDAMKDGEILYRDMLDEDGNIQGAKLNVPITLGVNVHDTDRYNFTYTWYKSEEYGPSTLMNETGDSITVSPTSSLQDYSCKVQAVDKTNPSIHFEEWMHFHVPTSASYSVHYKNITEKIVKGKPFTLSVVTELNDEKAKEDPSVTWTYVWKKEDTGEVLPSNGASCTITNSVDAEKEVYYLCEATASRNGQVQEVHKIHIPVYINNSENHDSIETAAKLQYYYLWKESFEGYDNTLSIPAYGTTYAVVVPRFSGTYHIGIISYDEDENENVKHGNYTFTLLNAVGQEITTPLTDESIDGKVYLEKGRTYYVRLKNEASSERSMRIVFTIGNDSGSAHPEVAPIDESDLLKPENKPAKEPTKTTSTETTKETEKPYLTLNVQNGSSVAMKVGQKSSAVHVKELAAGDSIASWTSSKSSVVKVSGKGNKVTLKAKKKGSAKITAVTKKGASVTFTVKVGKKTVKTKKVFVATKTVTLKKGQKYQLNIDLTPVTTQQKVKYQLSNKKVASVSGKGVVKAKKKGKTAITVKSGNKKYKVNVIVK